MNEKQYWYTPANGKRQKITINSEPDADGKQQFYMEDGTPGYLTPDEVKSLQAVEEEPATDPSQKEGSYEDYDGLANIDFSALTEEAPTTQPLSDSDWLASLTPDAKKREKALKGKKALDALNMVSQTIQVLGRLGNTSQGAGYAQPMLPDGYQKFMDRAYQQGMNYENTLAAREKVINAGKKLQIDYAVKRQKMILEERKYQLQLRRQEALNRKDEAQARRYEEQIKECQARIDALEKRTNAQITHYQVQDKVAQQRANDNSAVSQSRVGVYNAQENKLRNGTSGAETPSSTDDDERKKRQSRYDKYAE